MEWKDEEEREGQGGREGEGKRGQHRREEGLLRVSTGQLIFYKPGLERS